MPLEITSISWIDRNNLPTPGVSMLTQALLGGWAGWDDRCVIGLVATSNPAPPRIIADVAAFQRGKQYRSLASATLADNRALLIKTPILDPGWTPPFDKSKLPMMARAKSPPPEALKFHRGELSAVSTIIAKQQLPYSTLTVPMNGKVLLNMLIKFRAGEMTNLIGLDEAGSRYHVPWVWCETLLVEVDGVLTLLGSGSQFPSHAWYMNGRAVAAQLQTTVVASQSDPALSTGRPATLSRLSADADTSKGKVTSHRYTLASGTPVMAKNVDSMSGLPSNYPNLGHPHRNVLELMK